MRHIYCIGDWTEQKTPSVYSCGKYFALELNIETVCREFYALQAVECTMSTEFGRHSHDKWIQDFYKYKESFESKIAEMFRDYLAIATLGELRHCSYYSEKGLDFKHFSFNSNLSRNNTYIERREFTKESVLKCGVKMFNELYNGWHDSYGGHPWYQISKAGLMYGLEKNSVFIDHCFDLEHNGGCVFNKHAFLFDYQSSLNSFLSLKRDEKDTYNIISYAQSKTLVDLIQRAFNLDILKYNSSKSFKYVRGLGITFEFKEPLSIYFASRSEKVYINQFYEDNNRKMGTDKYYSLEEFMSLYHPYAWGEADMLKEAIIFDTGKKYENGENIYRYERRRDYDDAENY